MDKGCGVEANGVHGARVHRGGALRRPRQRAEAGDWLLRVSEAETFIAALLFKGEMRGELGAGQATLPVHHSPHTAQAAHQAERIPRRSAQVLGRP
ncbi:hypothetical protein GCM10020000_06580 [Streptomyces olivoverticillatus]